ncbi:MAG: Transketolase 2 [Firmicutes bacterium ADurb.BinA052]|nr:MAG: Transketolase 2 [Firmicutes bacterium ADurb.BinA052]
MGRALLATSEALCAKAREIRKHVVRMVGAASSGHPGGSLSAADIVTVLYFNEMNIRPDDPKWPDRDRFVLSKGHAAPVLYAALAEAGYFPAEELVTLRRIDSHLQGHPSIRSTPGVEMSTGSLGQGLSAACGMAIAAKLDGAAWRVYALLGDGELEEGQIWEAVMTAAHRRLDNLTAFVDANGLQIDGPVADIKSMERIGDRFAAFGWHVVEIDGHDIPAIMAALAEARNTQGRPTAIVARTVKGKGVSFMENQVGWHGTAPKPDQVQAALAELDASGEGGDIQ